MGRKKQTTAGRPMTFYLGDIERRALRSFRVRVGAASDSAALRKLLAVVAESEGIDIVETSATEV